MSTNRMEYDVNVSDRGSARKTVKSISEVGGALRQTEKDTKKASSATSELTYKLNQGITGSSSAARSFSKLNQAIGHGPNSLVASYATLAANTFAVVAAFSALREAAQVEQVLRGLEVQGAKTGRTLEVTAAKLKKVAGDAISTADAYRAVAQINAAGFGQKELLDLGEVATNAALALGRSIPDALERITRGVTKLEPELLDELGLMTKLTEATETYGLLIGKSANSLSSFEKRQAFLNAIVAEGKLKFQGIKEEIGTNPYDKLAASFDNLVKRLLSIVNVVGSVAASLGGLSEGAIFGALLLFGSKLGKQLVPALYTMSAASLKAREDLLAQAEGNKIAAKAALDHARAQQAQTISSARNLRELSFAPKKYREIADTLKQGTIEAKDYKQAITSIDRSIRARGTQLKNQYMGTELESEKKAQIKDLALLRKEVNALERSELQHSNTVINSTAESLKANRESYAFARKANAEGLRASAIQAAGNGELRLSWNLLTQSVKNYAIAQALASKAQFGKEIPASVIAVNGLKTAVFGLGTGLRMLGAGLLSALPYFGLFAMAASLASEAYDKLFKTDADREKAKALADYNTIVNSASEKIRQLIKTQEALASISGVTTQKLVAQGNAVTELADATLAAIKEYSDKISQEKSGGNVATLWSAMFGDSKDMASYLTGIAKDSKFIEPFQKALEEQTAKSPVDIFGYGALQSLTNTGALVTGLWKPFNKEFLTLSKTTENLTKIMGEDYTNALLDAYGGQEKLSKSPALMKSFINRASADYLNLANSVKTLEEAFKQAETSATEFINAAATNTRYDEILKSFQQINSAVFDMRNNVTATSADQMGLLSGIGPNSQRFLSESNQKLLETVRIQFNIKQQLEAQERNGIELSASQSRQLSAAKDQLEVLHSQSGPLIDNLHLVENQLSRMQDMERLRKSEIDSIQTILSSNQSAYESGEKGALARIAREEHIRALQVEQIKAQIDLNKAVLATSEAKLQQAEAERILSAATARHYNEIALGEEKTLISLLAQKGVRAELFDNPGSLTTYESLTLDSQTKSLLTALQVVKQGKDFTSEQLALDEKIRKEEIAIKGIRSANVALQNAINSLSQANLSAEQKSAIAAEARLKASQEIEDIYKNNVEALREIDHASKKIRDTLENSSFSSLYEINNVIQSASKDLEKVRRDTKKDVENISVYLNRLKADRNAAQGKGNSLEAGALTEQIETQQRLVKAKQAALKIQEASIVTSSALQIIEKAIIDTSKEGLEIQQKSIDTLKAFYSEKEKALGLEQEIYSIAKETQAIKLGTSISEAGQKAIEYKALQEQINIAKEQVEIKKYSIELEYALLEAQRVALVEELSARKAIIVQGAKAAGISSDTIDLMTEQLSAAISNLGRMSYDKVRGLALQNEERALEVLEAKAKKARAEIFSGFGQKDSFVSTLLQGLNDAKTLRESFISSRQEVKAKEVTNPVVDTNIALDNRLTETNRLLSELNSVFASLSGLKGSLKGTEPIEQVTGTQLTRIPSTIKNTMQAAIAVARKYGALENGFEYNSQSDVHNGAGHRSGRAIDVSLAAGDLESRDPVLKAKMGKMVYEYAAMGFTVLWNKLRYTLDKTSGEVLAKPYKKSWGAHTTHAHVETNNGERFTRTNTSRKSVFAPTPMESIPSMGLESLTKNAPTIDLAGTTKAQTEIVVTGEKIKEANNNIKLSAMETYATIATSMAPFIEQLKTISPEGEAAAGAISGLSGIAYGILNISENLADGKSSFESYTLFAAQALSSINSILTANSNAKISNIEKEIAAEQKRDGKSSESVAKMAELEKKKDSIARKSFNISKKLMMAQAVMATAAGVAGALSHTYDLPPGMAIVYASIIGAMGAAQLAIISKTSYQSADTATAKISAPSMSIGKRGSDVNLAKGANANAGGEVGYLRGQSGTGSNASDYRTIGSAYGGNPLRGYGNRGIIVGEKGPEVINPEVPVHVTPNSKMDSPNNVSATFNISAIDSKGVEDMLVSQKGNIIKMIRDAANANGKSFLEDVNVDVYTRASVSRL